MIYLLAAKVVFPGVIALIWALFTNNLRRLLWIAPVAATIDVIIMGALGGIRSGAHFFASLIMCCIAWALCAGLGWLIRGRKLQSKPEPDDARNDAL